MDNQSTTVGQAHHHADDGNGRRGRSDPQKPQQRIEYSDENLSDLEKIQNFHEGDQPENDGENKSQVLKLIDSPKEKV